MRHPLDYYPECDRPFHTVARSIGNYRYWPLADGYEYYYADDRLYAIRNKETGIVSLVYAGSPDEALETIIGREKMSFTKTFTESENDNIKKPQHYQGAFGLEAIDVVKNFIGRLAGVDAYYWGNVIKYLLRFQKKNGVEDLKKARQHLDWLIENWEEPE